MRKLSIVLFVIFAVCLPVFAFAAERGSSDLIVMAENEVLLAELVESHAAASETSEQVAEVSDTETLESLVRDVKLTPKTNFELHLKYSHATREDKGGKNKNDAISGIVRARFFEVGNKQQRTGFGLTVPVQFGWGKAGKTAATSEYDWNATGLMLNIKTWSRNSWNAYLDLGWEHDSTKTQNAKQTDDSISATVNYFIEQRRACGRRWFPDTDVYFKAKVPVSSEKKSSTGAKLTPDEKRQIDLKLTQSVYDIVLDDNNALTPNVSVGVGSQGLGTSSKFSSNAGIGVTWRNKGEDRITVRDEIEKIGSRVNNKVSVGVNFYF